LENSLRSGATRPNEHPSPATENQKLQLSILANACLGREIIWAWPGAQLLSGETKGELGPSQKIIMTNKAIETDKKGQPEIKSANLDWVAGKDTNIL